MVPRRKLLLVGALVLALTIPAMLTAWVARAQVATPVVGVPAGTPLPGAQTWNVLVNNVSPPGENWSFNTFYPDTLAVHPGDTIVFTLAPNAQAFHTVHMLVLGMTPLEWYSGFSGGFLQPDITRNDAWQRPLFGNQATGPCGSAGQTPCLFADNPEDISFGLSSPVLVNPPATDAQGNTSFAVTLDPGLRLGPRYVMSDVDGPTMVGRIDVVSPDQAVQTVAEAAATADRQYQDDMYWLAGLDRANVPAEASNPDGTKTWQVNVGSSGNNKPWLTVNEFDPSAMVIIAGDTVTWTNTSPGAGAQTVTGFAATADAIIIQDPYQAGCMNADGSLTLPAPGTFAPDVWNACPPNAEVYNLTEFSQPSAPSGEPFVEGARTSGILLPQAYLDSPIGDGLPFASSYTVTFPEAGTYVYYSAIHPDMIGTIVVVPRPMPR